MKYVAITMCSQTVATNSCMYLIVTAFYLGEKEAEAREMTQVPPPYNQPTQQPPYYNQPYPQGTLATYI